MLTLQVHMKAVMVLVLLGFDLKFQPPKPGKKSSIVTTASSAIMIALVVNGYCQDVIRWLNFQTGSAWQHFLSLPLVWITSPNLVAARSVWNSFALQSPVAALECNVRYRMFGIESLDRLGFPYDLGGAPWLTTLKQIYALILLPHLFLWGPLYFLAFAAIAALVGGVLVGFAFDVIFMSITECEFVQTSFDINPFPTVASVSVILLTLGWSILAGVVIAEVYAFCLTGKMTFQDVVSLQLLCNSSSSSSNRNVAKANKNMFSVLFCMVMSMTRAFCCCFDIAFVCPAIKTVSGLSGGMQTFQDVTRLKWQDFIAANWFGLPLAIEVERYPVNKKAYLLHNYMEHFSNEPLLAMEGAEDPTDVSQAELASVKVAIVCKMLMSLASFTNLQFAVIWLCRVLSGEWSREGAAAVRTLSERHLEPYMDGLWLKGTGLLLKANHFWGCV